MFCPGLWEAKAITGEVGNPIEVKCSHTYADTNVKYFCKDPCYDKDVLITSKTISNKKYTIREEGNTFYVTIHNLKLEDSGTYWCGIERVGADTYNKVLLTVIQGELAAFLNKLNSCFVFSFAILNLKKRTNIVLWNKKQR
uniref:Immunoglobulin domain-containing protein n=1 Tax=Nothobranchius furzeri TaxID=105023 RepID=A0A8C6P7P9_NOTFU